MIHPAIKIAYIAYNNLYPLIFANLHEYFFIREGMSLKKILTSEPITCILILPKQRI
jgi:hypothetical protein